MVAELQNALLLATGENPSRSSEVADPGLVPAPGRLDAEAGQLGGPFADVFWPGWPRRLPTPSKSLGIVDTHHSHDGPPV